MSKNRIIEDIMELTPIAKDSLTRMTIYDLNTLLKSLKGEKVDTKKIKQEIVPQPPLKRANKNKRNVKRQVKEEPIEEPAVEENNIIEEKPLIEEEELEDPFDNVEDIIEEVEEPIEEKQDIKPIPKPKKERNKKKEKTPKKEPKKEVKIVEPSPFDDIEEVEEEEELPPPTPLKRTKKRVVNERTECKEILTDFRKEVSKLIQQYKRVRTPQDHHKDKLCELYNEIYDKTCKYLNDTLETYRFVDESIYEYCNSLTDKEKVRIERLIGK